MFATFFDQQAEEMGEINVWTPQANHTDFLCENLS